jgi:hypothetical protein
VDPDSESGSGSGVRNPDPDLLGQKLPTKTKQNKKFHVLKYWMFSFFEVKGFSCSLDVLYGGLGIS